MSRNSRGRRDSAVQKGVDSLLCSASLDTLLPILDAASVSPTASHRLPSLSALFEALMKRSHNGPQTLSAAQLQSFVARVRDVDPAIASVEDFVPLDLRFEVEVPWFGELFAIAPAGLERPVAMVDLNRLLAEVIDPIVVPRVGFGLRDVGEVILRRVDEVVRAARAAWQIEQLPDVGAPAIVSEAEVAAVAALGTFSDIAQRCSNPVRAQAAIEALCVAPSELAANGDFIINAAATFGVVLGVSRGGQQIPLPAGALIEAQLAVGAHLAAEALRLDPRATNKFWVSVSNRIGKGLRGAGTRVMGPVDVGGIRPVHSLVWFGERQIVALDVVAGLSQEDLLARMPSENADPLDMVAPGATVTVNHTAVEIPQDAVVARGRVLAVPQGAGVVGGGNAPLFSLADLEWIVHSSHDTPDDLWAFLRDLGRPEEYSAFAWDMIDRWEVWRPQRSFLRSGVSPTFMMFAAHAASVEWEDAAQATPVERALHSLGMREIRAWPARATDGSGSAELLDLDSDEVWTVLAEPFPVAIRKSDLSGRTPYDDTLWNLSNSIAWKIEHCAQVLGDAAGASGLDGLSIAFRLVQREGDGEIGDVLTPADGDAATQLTIEWDTRLHAVLAADAGAGESRLGELIAGKFAPECREAVHAAWRSAPPGLRMDGYSVRPRITQLPAPLEPSLVFRSAVLREFAQHVAGDGVAPGVLHGLDARDFESRLVFPWLLQRLHRHLESHDADELLAFGLIELERAHHQRSMEDLKLGWRLGFPESSPDGVADKREQAMKLTRTISLLVEEALAHPPAGAARTESLAWAQALATAQLCIESCMRSDALHHGLDDTSIEVNDSYEINVQYTDAPTDIDFTRYKRERSAATRPAAVPVGVSGALSADSPDADADAGGNGDVDMPASVVDRLPALAEIDRELRSAVGFGIDALMGVLSVGAQWQDAAPESATVTDASTVAAECDDLVLAAGTVAEYTAALDWLTLRGSDLEAEAAKTGVVIPHWETDRRTKRVLTSPFVETPGGLWVLPWACEIAMRVVANYLEDGRLPWPNNSLPEPVVQALDDYRKVRNRQLELHSAAELDGRGFTVRTSVKKAKAYGLAILSGEIDVLCVDPGRGRIWVIEAKDPYLAFSAPQIRRLVDDFHAPKKYVDKLLKKVEDVKASLGSVAATLGVPDPDRQWEVVGLIVTRHVEAAAFAMNPRVAFCTIDTIAEAVDSDELPGPGWFVPVSPSVD